MLFDVENSAAAAETKQKKEVLTVSQKGLRSKTIYSENDLQEWLVLGDVEGRMKFIEAYQKADSSLPFAYVSKLWYTIKGEKKRQKGFARLAEWIDTHNVDDKEELLEILCEIRPSLKGILYGKKN